MPKIATLPRDQIGDSSAVLTRAFDDDPVFRYLYPTARRRRWACRRFLQAIVRDGLPALQLVVDTPSAASVA